MMLNNSFRRYFKIYVYALLGAGVSGIGLSLALDLNRIVIFPLFPDVLDAISIMTAGAILLYEMFKEAAR